MRINKQYVKIACALLFAVGVFAAVWQQYRKQSPKPDDAAILGPTTVQVGELVVLAVNSMDAPGATCYEWTTVPECNKTRTMEDGRLLVLVFDQPGGYTAILACGDDAGVTLSKHYIEVQGDTPVPPNPPAPEPDPEPEPEPEPQPDENWANWARATAESTVKSRSIIEQADALAGQLESLAAKIAAGGVKDAAEARVELRRSNAQALGRDAIEWSEFSNRFSKLCIDLEAKGDLKSLSQYRKIYVGVAAGLRQVKAPAARAKTPQSDCGPGGCPT